MALITKPFTKATGDTILASEYNSNLDTIYNDYNGNITNANVAGSAGIVDTKLAQITTASKVSGAALTGLASIVAAAGIIPSSNTGMATYIGGFVMPLNKASATVTQTGLGFAPAKIIFISMCPTSMSVGFFHRTTSLNVTVRGTDSNMAYLYSTSYCAEGYEASGIAQSLAMSATNSNGFTLANTLAGSPVNTASFTVYYLATQ